MQIVPHVSCYDVPLLLPREVGMHTAVEFLVAFHADRFEIVFGKANTFHFLSGVRALYWPHVMNFRRWDVDASLLAFLTKGVQRLVADAKPMPAGG